MFVLYIVTRVSALQRNRIRRKQRMNIVYDEEYNHFDFCTMKRSVM